MSENTYTVIDRRQKIPCGCGCGRETTLPHFVRHEGKLVLADCLDSHRERMAAQHMLRETVVVYGRLWQRVRNVGKVFRLQRSIFERQGASVARRSALRTAVIYLLGQRVGLWGSLLWRK